MIQDRVNTERLHERIKLSLTKDYTSESSSAEVLNGGGLGFLSTDTKKENLGFTEEGITAERLLEEHGNIEWLTEHGNFVVSNNGIEWAATYLIMLLALFFLGGGRLISVDYWLARTFRNAPPGD